MTSGQAAAVNQYVVARIALPVARIGGAKTKAVVFELLAIDWFLNIVDMNEAAYNATAFLSTNTGRTSGDTFTLASASVDAQDPVTLGMVLQHKGFVTSGGHMQFAPVHIDLTDNEGNGVLIATDSIFIVNGTQGNVVPGEATAKVLYRLKEVGIQEYVGIVQSQQG